MRRQDVIGLVLFLGGLIAFGYCLMAKLFDRWMLGGAFSFAVLGTYCMIPDRMAALLGLGEEAWRTWRGGGPAADEAHHESCHHD